MTQQTLRDQLTWRGFDLSRRRIFPEKERTFHLEDDDASRQSSFRRHDKYFLILS